MTISTVEAILEDFRQGKMVLMMDDEGRENEGDLMIAADVITADHITFYARHACGLICFTVTEERALQLNLPLMVKDNGCQHGTNFTVSIEAATDISTGISATDRAHTVRTAVAKDALPSDLVQPGHIFPLIAKRGGVLTRAGHTEAGCDLARLAGYEPAAVIVEVMNEDGSMAKRPELEVFAEKHQLRVGTIADLIQYRNLHDKTIESIDTKSIMTASGKFQLHTYKDSISDRIHYALVKGELKPDEPCLVRVQVMHTLRDLFQTQAPDFAKTWSWQDAMSRIAEEGRGVLVLVGQALSHSEELDQVTHFPAIPPSQRHDVEAGGYRVVGIGSQILRDVGVGKMRLLSSPSKFNAISGFQLEVIEFIEK